MATHKLVPYWLRLRESYDTEEYWDLNNLTQHCDEFSHDSIVDVLDDFFEQYAGVDDDSERQRTFHVSRREADSTVVEGEIKLGRYGIEADVWDTEEKERIEGHRQTHHSEEIPYYFFYYQPPNVDTRGVLVLKQFRTGGTKGELYRRLDEHFTDIYEDTHFELNTVYTQDAEERVMEADTVKKLKFEGEQELTPVDEYADNEDATDIERKTIDRTYTIKPTSDDPLTPDFALSFLPNRNWKYGQLKKDEYSDVRVTVEQDGARFTFSLWNPNIQMRRELDPTEDALDMVGGHPTAESLSPRAREVANAVLPPEADSADGDTIL